MPIADLTTSALAPDSAHSRTRVTCRHCGATSPSGEEFCCAGCAYVFRLLHDEGLANYYNLKDAVIPPATDATLPARDYHWLAAAAVAAETASLSPQRAPELRLDIQGLSCIGCVWLIEKLFQKTPGSGRIEVNAQTGQLRLTWLRGQFDAAAFAITLQRFNYFVAPATAERSAPPESRALIRRIGLCAAFAMNVMLFALPNYFGMKAGETYAHLFGTLALAFATLSLLAGGGYFLQRAVASLRLGAMNIDLPIALGIVGAYGGSLCGWLAGAERFVYFDFVATFILLMLIGRWAQIAAVERNQRRLLAQQPKPLAIQVVDVATWKRVERQPEELRAENIFVLRPGQTLPVNARLCSENAAAFNLAWINGEADPRTYQPAQHVPAGAIYLGQTEAVFEATQGWGESLLAELLKPTERPEHRHAFIDRVIQGYLVAILLLALGSGLGWWWATGDLLRTGAVVTAVLVVSCPCAIGLAFPLADEMATVALRKRGVFVRVGDLWPRLAKVRRLVFDKTGTLTLETPVLQNPVALFSLAARELSALLALVQDNPHPVARTLHEHLLARGVGAAMNGKLREEIGQGVSLATQDAVWSLSRSTTTEERADTVFSCDNRTLAKFSFADQLRSDALTEIDALRQAGFRINILSGDRNAKVAALADALGLPADAAVAELTPREKAEWIARYDQGDTLMLGDGANDSLAFDQALCRGTPVIHRGALTQKADFYYLGRGIAGVRALFEVDAVRRKTQRVLLWFSVLYNLGAVGLAVAGEMNPLLAAILMPVSSLLTLAIVLGGIRPAYRAGGFRSHRRELVDLG